MFYNKDMQRFKLVSDFLPTGDQPQAIEKLTAGVNTGMSHQVLLGTTGSGKTFSIANVIEKLQRPTLVISHNKTLAAQLYQEYKAFFPGNAVCYFVSYYDYYQPEAYIPQTDTYIEKDADINEEIDKLRLAATAALLTRRDVIVVASVSCIYGLGSPQEYGKVVLQLKQGNKLSREDLQRKLISLFYERNDYDFKRGTFRVRGEIVDIWPAYLDYAIRLNLTNNVLQSIQMVEPTSGKLLTNNHELFANTHEFQLASFAKHSRSLASFTVFPAKHYITPEQKRSAAIKQIRQDLFARIRELKSQGKHLEAHRLKQKTNYDLELIEEIGYCKGIENYSRYFDGRTAGEPPYTLLDFFNYSRPFVSDASCQTKRSDNIGASPIRVHSHENGERAKWLLVVDESHMTVPQIQGMYRGDKSRKETLIDYGFRLPSALDNRPLRFEEFLERVPEAIYTSATPAPWEIKEAIRAAKKSQVHQGIVEQLIRPTGLLDPAIEIRGSKNQVVNLIKEIITRTKRKERVLVTTLTKRMAEELSNYLAEQGIRVHYLHADVQTLERTDILESLRRGKYDVVVGINLLREGLDLPEVSLVAILDADKEGFLRSETSLIQTMGRAARHVHGKVIMYADTVTGSMRRAIDEVNRRRKVQEEYNKKHDIIPQTITKPIRDKLVEKVEEAASKTKTDFADIRELIREYSQIDSRSFARLTGEQQLDLVRRLTSEMLQAAGDLEFERAASLRDQVEKLKGGAAGEGRTPTGF